MGWVVLIAVVLLLAVIIFSVYAQKKRWKTLLEGKEMTDELSNQYNYLLEQNIRCRLKESTASGTPGQAGMAMDTSGGVQKIRVQVHKDDYEKALSLLKNYASPGTYSPISNF